MTFWNAILLGAVQGAAEFFPISSSGHLAIVQNFLRIGIGEDQLLFDVMLHLGTLLAVLVAFWPDVCGMVTELLRMLHVIRLPRHQKPDAMQRRMILFLIFASVPLIAGAFLNDAVEELCGNTFFVGFMLLVSGTVLFFADRVGHGNKNVKSATLGDAVTVGLAQLLAVFPGLSRSGMTISTGLFCGFDRDFAVKFSFLMSIPTVLGACVFSVADAVGSGIVAAEVPLYLAGMAAAFVVGYIAIYLMRRMMQRSRFGGFAYYCWGAGLVTLILSLIA